MKNDKRDKDLLKRTEKDFVVTTLAGVVLL